MTGEEHRMKKMLATLLVLLLVGTMAVSASTMENLYQLVVPQAISTLNLNGSL